VDGRVIGRKERGSKREGMKEARKGCGSAGRIDERKDKKRKGGYQGRKEVSKEGRKEGREEKRNGLKECRMKVGEGRKVGPGAVVTGVFFPTFLASGLALLLPEGRGERHKMKGRKGKKYDRKERNGGERMQIELEERERRERGKAQKERRVEGGEDLVPKRLNSAEGGLEGLPEPSPPNMAERSPFL
jgi:hypothetical protein